MRTVDLRQVVSKCEGLKNRLVRTADREAICGSRSHLVPAAEGGEQVRGDIRDPKQFAVVFAVRRHNRSSESAQVAETGVIEESGIDDPRLTGRPALIHLR